MTNDYDNDKKQDTNSVLQVCTLHSRMEMENIKWTWSFYWATLFFSCLGLYFLSDAFSGFFWLFMAAYPGEQHSQSIHFHHHEVHEYWLLWPVQLLLHANSCWILLQHTLHCLFSNTNSKMFKKKSTKTTLLLRNCTINDVSSEGEGGGS